MGNDKEKSYILWIVKREYIFVVIWFVLMICSFLFPKWLYYELQTNKNGNSRVLKYDAGRYYRFKQPPLFKYGTFYDAVEPRNENMLFEWIIINGIYVLLFWKTYYRR